MGSDNRTFGWVVLALVVLAAAPFAVRQVHEALRPRLDGARIVTATSSDPVLRTGPRVVAPGESLEIAVAVRIRRFGGELGWIAPRGPIEIDATAIDTVAGDRWPGPERQLRVFWFTVESVGLGGDLGPTEAARGLRYRTFLAPELGRGITAAGLPEPHNDDHLGAAASALAVDAGTIRVYARVELVRDPGDIAALAAVSTAGPDRVLEPTFPALRLQAELASGVRVEAGELFRLPGYEPVGGDPSARNAVTVETLGLGFDELVRHRLVTSSATFAATAATGHAALDPGELPPAGALVWTGTDVERDGRAARWPDDLRSGDLVGNGGHWLVALSDDGDGVVGPGDRFAHCWRRPPEITSLAAALGPEPSELRVHRHDG